MAPAGCWTSCCRTFRVEADDSPPARPNDGRKAQNLSQFDLAPKEPSIKSRRISILVVDGSTRPSCWASRLPSLLRAPYHSPLYYFEGQRSTLFDAIIVPPGAASAAALSQDGRVVHWVREAFRHCKPIGAIGEGVALVRVAPASGGANLDVSNDIVVSYGVVTTSAYTPSSLATDLKIGTQEKGWFSKFAYELSLGLDALDCYPCCPDTRIYVCQTLSTAPPGSCLGRFNRNFSATTAPNRPR
ncbi:hypothetical protein EXIGLDRAFT_780380 [Exidia glandulosa HHB12029]|uniref:catalase n=1 Tax=Exidia glandulosa HHB12029 TaxID=1314781 RepID=A0A165BMQ5_EXIGL|nr:hypothetical protein EXIGLDRAFT_780380 [Exidia glandulosa HHB12029]